MIINQSVGQTPLRPSHFSAAKEQHLFKDEKRVVILQDIPRILSSVQIKESLTKLVGPCEVKMGG